MKGKIIYVPKSILKELDKIKRDNKSSKNINALNDLANYSRIGREVGYINSLNFKKMHPFKRRK